MMSKLYMRRSKIILNIDEEQAWALVFCTKHLNIDNGLTNRDIQIRIIKRGFYFQQTLFVLQNDSIW